MKLSHYLCSLGVLALFSAACNAEPSGLEDISSSAADSAAGGTELGTIPTENAEVVDVPDDVPDDTLDDVPDSSADPADAPSDVSDQDAPDDVAMDTDADSVETDADGPTDTEAPDAPADVEDTRVDTAADTAPDTPTDTAPDTAPDTPTDTVDTSGDSDIAPDVERTCDDIEAEYLGLITAAERCNEAEVCHLLRGHCGAGLGGCYHATSPELAQETLDDLSLEWLDKGCSEGRPICRCAGPPPVGCGDGICELRF